VCQGNHEIDEQSNRNYSDAGDHLACLRSQWKTSRRTSDDTRQWCQVVGKVRHGGVKEVSRTGARLGYWRKQPFACFMRLKLEALDGMEAMG